MKLITPPSLLLTTALLATYSVAAGKIALIERSYALGVGAALAAVACAGTAYMRRWSPYVVYLVTIGFIYKWCWSVMDGWRAGFFSFMHGTPWQSIQSLIPGFTLIVISCLCSWLVYLHFRREYNVAGGAD